jgi:two-component system, NarL family, response regulator NreC
VDYEVVARQNLSTVRMMKVISLLVIGDEAIMRLGIQHLLMSDPSFEVKGEATSRDAVEQAGRLKPEVLIVFAEGARPSCVRLIESVRKELPRAGIVVLGREPHQSHLGQLLAAGALGYVLLSASPREIRDAIRDAARGRRFVDHRLGDAMFEVLTRQAESGTKLLSQREEQVLRMLAYGHTLIEIATQLQIGRKSIETYRARIREKLGLHTRADIVRYALETGVLNAESQRRA